MKKSYHRRYSTPRHKDLVGQKFGRLTVQKLIKCDRRGAHWECLCRCGATPKSITAYLQDGRKQSCGCLKLGKNHYGWSGFEGITGFAWNGIVSGAKERSIEFDITIQDAWCLFLKQQSLCALTGIPIVLASNTKELLNRQQTASLDRIDSQQGYKLGNIQWVHKIINRMKSDLTETEFIIWCQKVADHHGKTIFSV